MYKVEIAHIKDWVFKVNSDNYEFTIGLKGEGVSPPDTLLASLGSCIGVYIRKYAQGSGLVLKNFNITVEADFNKELPVCFKEIKVYIDFKGIEIDERRKKALIDFIKNCPVHNTLKNSPHIEVSIAPAR